MEELKSKDMETLKERLKTCDFKSLVKRLCEEYFDLKRVAIDRDK